MALPEVLHFEGMTRPTVIGGVRTLPCYYRHVATRPPMAGEWYVSGADPMAYRAKKDMTTSYMVVVPVNYAVPATGWARGPVVLE